MSRSTRLPNVMLIDDNEVDQTMYRRLIARSDEFGEVHSFYYAQEALDWLQSQNKPCINIILLDINMPRMNGFEFLEAATLALGDAFAEVVVMLTTSVDPQDLRRAEQFAVVKDFFSKPLTRDQLNQVLKLVGVDQDKSEKSDATR